MHSMSLRFRFLILTALLGSFLTHAETFIDEGSSVSGVWTIENAPYRIRGWVTIEEASRLEIEAGVCILFEKGARRKSGLHSGIKAFGEIQAKGTASQPVIFLPVEETLWGIRITNGFKHNLFEYCWFESPGSSSAFGMKLKGVFSLNGTRGSLVNRGKTFLTHSIIFEARHGLNAGAHDLIVTSCIFYGREGVGKFDVYADELGSIVKLDKTYFHRGIKLSKTNRAMYKKRVKDCLVEPNPSLFVYPERGDFRRAIRSSPRVGHERVSHERMGTYRAGKGGLFAHWQKYPGEKDFPNNPRLKYRKRSTWSPPQVAIGKLYLDEPTLMGMSQGSIKGTLEHTGGEGTGALRILMQGGYEGLKFAKVTQIPGLEKGRTQAFHLPVETVYDVRSGVVELELWVVEDVTQRRLASKTLRFPVRAYKRPDFVIKDVHVKVFRPASPNSTLMANDEFEVSFTLENSGAGDAYDVDIDFFSNQEDLLVLGFGDRRLDLKPRSPVYEHLPSKDELRLVYRCILNSQFDEPHIRFGVGVNEKYGHFGHEKKLTYRISGPQIGFTEADAPGSGPLVKQTQNAKGVDGVVQERHEEVPQLGQYGRKYAIIIGVSNYLYLEAKPTQETGLTDLKYAHKDAVAFKAFFEKPAHGGRDWQFLDLVNSEATMNNVDEALTKTLTEARPNDLIFIFFSGHGRSHPRRPKDVYLLTHDFRPGQYRDGFLYATLRELIVDSKARHIIAFIDACRSGVIGFKGEGYEGRFDQNLLRSRLEDIDDNKVIFTSGRDKQQSWEDDDLQQGLFTHYLLKGLGGAAPERANPQFVDLGELMVYVREKVFEHSKNHREMAIQHPKIFASDGISLEEFPVALRPEKKN